jgi:hypothetical protein
MFCGKLFQRSIVDNKFLILIVQMPCCGGGRGPGGKKNDEINRYLRDEKRKLDAEVKLLLLGTIMLLKQI